MAEELTKKDMALITMYVMPEFDADGNPTREIPIKLYDQYQRKEVELNPDAEVSYRFANEYTATYSNFKIAHKGDELPPKEKYKIRKDYRIFELGNKFEQLTPEEKDETIAFLDELIAKRNKPEPKEEVKSTGGTGNNSTENQS